MVSDKLCEAQLSIFRIYILNKLLLHLQTEDFRAKTSKQLSGVHSPLLEPPAMPQQPFYLCRHTNATRTICNCKKIN
jgi:hypothetical protein